jgi:type I restriction enzyme S subunit
LTKLRELPILVPDIELQHKFEKQSSYVENQLLLSQTNINISESLFQSLLQQAFKGELT